MIGDAEIWAGILSGKIFYGGYLAELFFIAVGTSEAVSSDVVYQNKVFALLFPTTLINTDTSPDMQKRMIHSQLHN